MKKLIVVADWADDKLTCQEIRTAVEGFLKDPTCPNINFVGSTPSTLHTSYILSQIVEVEERYGRSLETVIFQNTDPRIQTKDSVEKAKGAELIIVKLKSGIFILGPNAGYDFSLLKDKIDVVYHYPNMHEGSQFRSRDLYSRVSAHLMDAMEDDMDFEEAHTNLIPELAGYFIGHIDNYGNIKTTIKTSDLKGKFELGDMVNVTINGVTRQAKYVSNLFGGIPGNLVIYPGSTGNKDDFFLEISIWRHFTEGERTTGIHEFNNPHPGMEIEIA